MLDFACAHTQPTEQGHALTLTIWGQAECTSARNVSNMSIPEIASLWTVSPPVSQATNDATSKALFCSEMLSIYFSCLQQCVSAYSDAALCTIVTAKPLASRLYLFVLQQIYN